MALLMSCFRNRALISLSSSKNIINATSQQEFSTTGINSAKAIEIPSKPKRPLTAFFRFVQENRSSVVPPEGIKTPARYVTEHLAVKWRDVSTETKLRFKNLYEKEKVDYIKKLVAFESSLTNEQRAIIRKNQEDKKAAEQKKILKQKIRDSGRPKRPIHALQLFFVEECKKQPNIKVSEVAKLSKTAWDKLSANEQSVYSKQAVVATEKYKKELVKWEEKMFKEGNLEVLSKKALAERKKENETKTTKHNTKK